MSPVLSSAPSLHPVFVDLVRRHLAEGLPVHADAMDQLLERSTVAQRSALAWAVSQSFASIDRELDQTMEALDQSMNEAVALNTELQARASSLEAALADKEKALRELGQAKVQLLNQEKLASIGTLAAGIAHEINTPTQFVSDNLSFLQDAFQAILALVQTVDGAQVQAQSQPAEAWAQVHQALKVCDLDFFRNEIPGALQQSLEGMERVAHIVRSMKEFSHPGKGGKQAVDLNRNILSTITVCRNEWKYVAEVETDLAADLPPVPCAADEVNQVVLNLVVNAVHAIQDSGKYSNSKGLIRVSSRRDGEGVCIDISDSGCGIPDSIRARIFDPFFTTKEVGRGTGQGLALAHGVVVEKHQGRLTFDTIQGQGTTFHLWLPLAGSLT
jgi:two-component system NtrC family sensor kinase